MVDFQEQVRRWMEDKDYYCPQVKWEKIIQPEDESSCIINAILAVNIEGIENSSIACHCSTENKEDAIYSAVDAMSEKILRRLSNIDFNF